MNNLIRKRRRRKKIRKIKMKRSMKRSTKKNMKLKRVKNQDIINQRPKSILIRKAIMKKILLFSSRTKQRRQKKRANYITRKSRNCKRRAKKSQKALKAKAMMMQNQPMKKSIMLSQKNIMKINSKLMILIKLIKLYQLLKNQNTNSTHTMLRSNPKITKK
jgi:hypothetical protein